jgi:hypothetical protein
MIVSDWTEESFIGGFLLFPVLTAQSWESPSSF